MVRREEVELTEETLGTGGWGEVKVANFRGLRVAAKFLHKVIISNYNRRQFSREMAMAAKIRHPNRLVHNLMRMTASPSLVAPMNSSHVLAEIYG